MTTLDCDVVIVGAGIAGAILADQLGQQGVNVIVLEAGPGPLGGNERQTYLTAFKKGGNGYPYPVNQQALKEYDFLGSSYRYYVPPDDLTTRPEQGPVPLSEAPPSDPYQDTHIINATTAKGDWYQTNYERQAGGTTWHWLGTALRLLPNDFKLRTTYNPGSPSAPAWDWPITYENLEPYYGKAEMEIGVSGSSSGNGYFGLKRSSDYPMPAIPQSYLDSQFTAALQHPSQLSFNDKWVNKSFPMLLSPTPQARNSVPGYKGRNQCEGSSSCIPVCPIQAKYDATQHIQSASNRATSRMEFRYRSVVTRVVPDQYGAGDVAPIVKIEYKTWDKVTHQVTGRIYVLAAHALENAKILLNSPYRNITVANSSGQVGRNLSDHLVSLVYGLTDNPVYGYRGPLSTSGIESLRDGSFRASRGAFRMEIGNDGWTWPTGGPYDAPQFFLDQKLYGKALSDQVAHRLVRQTRIACLVEQLPNPNFRVQLSDQMDALGIPRPQLTYGVDEYARFGLSAAVAASIQVFSRLIANPIVEYNYTNLADNGKVWRDEARSQPGTPNIFVREGWNGAGHLMGTHRMGSDRATSVVDRDQRTWDHPNLFLLGSGNWPSYGTGNPTLTIAALAIRAADAIVQQLTGGTTVGAPDPPTNVVAVPSDGAVTVSFDLPLQKGSKSLVMATATSDPPTQPISGPPNVFGSGKSSLYGGQLTDNTSYTFTVTVTNDAGYTSAPSDPSAPVTSSGGGERVPGAPTIHAFSKLNGHYQLTLDVPSDLGSGQLMGFKVYPLVGTEQTYYGDPIDLAPDPLSTSLHALDFAINEQVSIQVTASNQWGEGPRSPRVYCPFGGGQGQ